MKAKKVVKIRESVERMERYNPPLEMRGERDYLLLDFNESTQPPPLEMRQMLSEYILSAPVNVYPSYSSLTEKISHYTGVQEDQILLTNGSDQAIEVIMRSLVDPGDEVVFPVPGFAMFRQAALIQGARLVSPVFKDDMSFPFQEICDSISPKTKVVVLINPNNPTGSTVSQTQIETLMDRFPQIMFLVDEAYYEYTGSTAVPLLDRYSNLVIIRTFSKAFAMAGLRLGYALGSLAFVESMKKVRGPYDVNILAVKAAEWMLANLKPIKSYISEVMTEAKPLVEAFFRSEGVRFFPSAANFMLVHPDDPREAYLYLKDQNILVRPQKAPIDHTFRLSVGTVENMKQFIQKYKDYLEINRS